MYHRCAAPVTSLFSVEQEEKQFPAGMDPAYHTVMREDGIEGRRREKRKEEVGLAAAMVPPRMVLGSTASVTPRIASRERSISSLYEFYDGLQPRNVNNDVKENGSVGKNKYEKGSTEIEPDPCIVFNASFPIREEYRDDGVAVTRYPVEKEYPPVVSPSAGPLPPFPFYHSSAPSSHDPLRFFVSGSTRGVDHAEGIGFQQPLRNLLPGDGAPPLRGRGPSSPQGDERALGHRLHRKIKRLQHHIWMDRLYFTEYARMFFVAQESGMRRELQCEEKQKRAELLLAFYQGFVTRRDVGCLPGVHCGGRCTLGPVGVRKASCSPPFFSFSPTSSAVPAGRSLFTQKERTKSEKSVQKEDQNEAQREIDKRTSRRKEISFPSDPFPSYFSHGPFVESTSSWCSLPEKSEIPAVSGLPSTLTSSSFSAGKSGSPSPFNPCVDKTGSDTPSVFFGDRDASSQGLSNSPFVLRSATVACGPFRESTRMASTEKENHAMPFSSITVSADGVVSSTPLFPLHPSSAATTDLPPAATSGSNRHGFIQKEEQEGDERQHFLSHLHDTSPSPLSVSLSPLKTPPSNQLEKKRIEELTTTVAQLQERVRCLSTELSDEAALTNDMQEEIDDLMLQELVLLEESTRAKIERNCIENGMNIVLEERKSRQGHLKKYARTS